MLFTILGVGVCISAFSGILCLAILCHNKIRLGFKLTFLGQILAFIGTFILSDYREQYMKRPDKRRDFFNGKKGQVYNSQ
jgi:hypothetical protein